MNHYQNIATHFLSERHQLAQDFLHDENANTYLKKHSDSADRAIKQILENTQVSPRIAVVAVGGYGREQLFPFSDLDILFLLPDDVLDKELQKIEETLGELWTLGLTIGHSVRSIDECIEQAKEDITVQTAMLESRLLWGNTPLFQKYQSAIFENLDQQRFFRAKFIEQQQRHLKYNESPYSLEPNIKESPGGLRDLNILIWLMKATEFGGNWEEVAQNGLITKREADLLDVVTTNLYRLRILMHLHCNRHEDRLLFEIQESIAKALKIPEIEGRRSSEILMQRYYLNAKTISQFNTILLQAIKEKFLPEKEYAKEDTQYFVINGEILDIRSDDTFVNNPHAILNAFLFQCENPKVTRKSTRLCRALLATHNLIDDKFRNDPINKETFLRIIRSKEEVYHALSEMNRWGILGRFLPIFRHIVGQMQHDLFHAYTVDQHTILAIRYLRHFTKSENAHEMPLCTELMLTIKDNWRLVLTLLFHDIGKGYGGDHSRIGEEYFLRFAKEFNLGNEDRNYIAFLVREHLTLSQVAQKQDISDPLIIEQFAQKVGNIDRLMGLYLITVCDIRATSPTIWNAWKGQLLEALYLETAKVLKGRGMSRETLVQRRRKDALPLCQFTLEQEKLINRFWNNLDVAYFMRHSVKDIVWHAKSILPVLSQKRTITAVRDLHDGQLSYEILVLTEDRPELFADIASYFQRYHCSILQAQIHTGRDGWVLDSFIVTNDGKELSSDALIKNLETELPEFIDQRKTITPITGRLSRRSKIFPITPSVTIRPDANGCQYLLSIIAIDRLGLLASIARTLVEFKINLITARITTLGERVEDVFLIEGALLSNTAKTQEFERTLLELIDI